MEIAELTGNDLPANLARLKDGNHETDAWTAYVRLRQNGDDPTREMSRVGG